VNSVCTRLLNTATVLKQWSFEEVCALVWLMQEVDWQLKFIQQGNCLVCVPLSYSRTLNRDLRIFSGCVVLIHNKACHTLLYQTDIVLHCFKCGIAEQTVNLASSSYCLFSVLTQKLGGHRFNADDVCKIMAGSMAK
jgi:hypothetical protein